MNWLAIWGFQERLTSTRGNAPPRTLRRKTLMVQQLEERRCLAITFDFDYSLDSSGFFNSTVRRDLLELAGRTLGARLEDRLSAIVPSGTNTWQAKLEDPSTGVDRVLDNLTIPANTLKVFVGARNIPGTSAAEGGPGGVQWNGSDGWGQTVTARGQFGASTKPPTDFGPWGGTVSFDTGVNWHFSSSTRGLDDDESDFLSVALHELGHVLGFGTAESWERLVANREFTGTKSFREFDLPGNPRVTDPDSQEAGHWVDETLENGAATAMDPSIPRGARTEFTALDFAGLDDLGWELEPNVSGFTLVTGSDSGRPSEVRFFRPDRETPEQVIDVYPGFRGGVRVAAGDVNGDGTMDIITAPGRGGGPNIRVLDGRTGEQIPGPTGSFFAYHPQFSGGVHVASGDFNQDGFADIVTGAGLGGGPHVKIFDGRNGSELGGYFAFDPRFDGGVRVAAGDVNGDGKVDVVAGAGVRGGPHVKVFSGVSDQIIPGELGSFFAYHPQFGGGVYVAAGDLNGDGRADVITGAGGGGGPHVKALAGGSGAELLSFFAYHERFSGGVRVGTGDVDGDGLADILTGAGPRGGPHVVAFSGRTGEQFDNGLFAYEPDFAGGVFVAGGHSGPFRALRSADGSDQRRPTTAALNQESLDSIVAAAIDRWESTGLDPAQRERLRQMTFTTADLAQPYLGLTYRDQVLIDADAAGNGWFVDPTPQDDLEFAFHGAGRTGIAHSQAAIDRVDLLSVVLHELGHVLGLDDLDPNHDVMAAELATAIRLAAGARH